MIERQNNLIKINASELIQKCRSKEDMVNLSREMGYYFPGLPGFDGKFFIHFLKGQKKLLPLGRTSGYTFRYFTSDGKFTKKDIISKLANIPNAKDYLPDDIKAEYLSREFLFSVFSYLAPNEYVKYYNEYKMQMASKNYKKWNYYDIEITQEMSEKLKNYVSTNNPGKFKPFRIKKNGQDTGCFKANEENEINIDENINEE